MDAAGAHGDAVRTLACLFSPLMLRLRGAQEDGLGVSVGAGGEHLAEDVARADHVLELLIEHHAAILRGSSGPGRSFGPVEGLSHSSTAMNANAGPGGVGAGERARSRVGEGGDRENVTGVSRAMRELHLDVHDKENAHTHAAAAGAAGNKAHTKSQQHDYEATPRRSLQPHQQSTAATATSAVAAECHAGVEFLVGSCVGGLLGGDDLFTAEVER